MLLFSTQHSFAGPDQYVISTMVNNKNIGDRRVISEELISSAYALTITFDKERPDYKTLLTAARNSTAKERCFNLYALRFTGDLIKTSQLNISSNVKGIIRNAINTIDQVNKKQSVKCKIEASILKNNKSLDTEISPNPEATVTEKTSSTHSLLIISPFIVSLILFYIAPFWFSRFLRSKYAFVNALARGNPPYDQFRSQPKRIFFSMIFALISIGFGCVVVLAGYLLSILLKYFIG